MAAQATDLRDAAGNLIEYDDADGSYFQPTITFTARATGTYVVEVLSYPAPYADDGDYMVSFN